MMYHTQLLVFVSASQLTNLALFVPVEYCINLYMHLCMSDSSYMMCACFIFQMLEIIKSDAILHINHELKLLNILYSHLCKLFHR